jgi:hypothetical protein
MLPSALDQGDDYLQITLEILVFMAVRPALRFRCRAKSPRA